jgi:hypothetical protein
MANEMTITGTNETIVTSLTLSTIEDKKKMFNAMNVTDFSLSDHLDEPIHVVDYLIHDCEISDDNGEVQETKRLVIFDKDGKTYSTVSNSAYDSFGKIITIFGEPSEWNGEIAIRATERKSRKYKFISLEVC